MRILILTSLVLFYSGIASANWPTFDWTGRHKQVDMWNQSIFYGIDSIVPDLTQHKVGDITSFCPNYAKLGQTERKYFWIALLAAMARFESNHRPEVKYTEAFTDSTGRRVISRGLLQLSYESARGYKCPIQSGQDLHDAKINLQCGLRIIERWVDRDGVISGKWSGKWKGGARYWSVLRKSSTLSQIKNKTRALYLCQ